MLVDVAPGAGSYRAVSHGTHRLPLGGATSDYRPSGCRWCGTTNARWANCGQQTAMPAAGLVTTLVMRQEYRTFKSVASRPCDWLLLVLAMRVRGASLTKTDGKIDEYQGLWRWDTNYSTFLAW